MKSASLPSGSTQSSVRLAIERWTIRRIPVGLYWRLTSVALLVQRRLDQVAEGVLVDVRRNHVDQAVAVAVGGGGGTPATAEVDVAVGQHPPPGTVDGLVLGAEDHQGDPLAAGSLVDQVGAQA